MQLAAIPGAGITDDVFTRAVRRVFDFGRYIPALLDHDDVRPLIDAVNNTMSESLAGITTEVPAELISKLRSDLFVFSACKTAAELREVSSLLIDPDGKVRSWEQFRLEAVKVGKLYNEAYLEAEYNFATQSAEMCARWSDLSQDADRYLLQYRTAGDERVRESHQALNRVTLPASAGFWNDYYPPNGWRCRCQVVQVLKSKYEATDEAAAVADGEAATTATDKDGRNRLAMFRFNAGKQEVIFPPNHPYFKFKGDLNVG